MEGDEADRGVFNRVEAATPAGLFSIQAADLDTRGGHMDLCVTLFTSYPLVYKL